MLAMLALLNSIRNLAGGYKTYAIVAFTIAAVVVEKGLQIDLPYVVVGDDWFKLVTEMLGLGTIRAGIATAVKNFNKPKV